MAYVICEPCIDVMDKSCVEVCPVDCIHYEEGKDRKLYIDPDECIDCGACEPVCPVTAIFAEEDVPDQWKEYIQLDAMWYKDPEAVRARINELKPPA
ncbi:MAG: ferredoxin family protein [Dehalococcoidia bacterium]|jgi:NAD-dependent dihydropyrimidine dehydrogenase PreA subunit|nr:ferredoxin family protein [Dehalococcoidia bacterium]